MFSFGHVGQKKGLNLLSVSVCERLRLIKELLSLVKRVPDFGRAAAVPGHTAGLAEKNDYSVHALN